MDNWAHHPARPPKDLYTQLTPWFPQSRAINDRKRPLVVDLTGDENHEVRPGKQSCPSPPPAQLTQKDDGHEIARSAYLRHFEDALNTVMRARSDYADLFTPLEHQIAHRFDRLSESAKALYVRLFQRRGPWIRVDSMLGYAEVGSATPPRFRPKTDVDDGVAPLRECPPRPQCDNEERRYSSRKQENEVEGLTRRSTSQESAKLYFEMQVALRELVEVGFLEALPEDVRGQGTDFNTTLEAVECCLRVGELKVLLKSCVGAKAKRKSSITAPKGEKRLTLNEGRTQGGRQDMIQDLRRMLTGQRTLWGARLPLQGEIARVLDESLVLAGIDLSCENAGKLQMRQHRLVRVSWDPCSVFRRVLRLLYLTCNTEALSSGRGIPPVSAEPNAPPPPTWSPGLAVAFGKAKYARYECDIRTKAFRTGGREEFLSWEAAVELCYAMGKSIEEHLQKGRVIPVKTELKRPKHRAKSEAVGDSFTNPVVKSHRGVEAEGAHASNNTPSESVNTEDLSEEVRSSLDTLSSAIGRFLLLPKTSVVDQKHPQQESCLPRSLTLLGPEAPQQALRLDMLSGLRMTGGRAGVEVSSAAAAIAVACSHCLHAYCGTQELPPLHWPSLEAVRANNGISGKWDEKEIWDALHVYMQGKACEMTLCTGGTGTRMRVDAMNNAGLPTASESLLGVKEGDGDTPEFLLQLDAGWVLASAVWEGVGLLERERRYEVAVSLLAQLLGTR
ncbi:unnamed protein product [Choristocarpus tenellus]